MIHAIVQVFQALLIWVSFYTIGLGIMAGACWEMSATSNDTVGIVTVFGIIAIPSLFLYALYLTALVFPGL